MLRNEIEKFMFEALTIAESLLRTEYIAQGHVNRGRLINDMEKEVRSIGRLVVGELLVNDYARVLETGVRPGNIPYRRGSGATRSRYIQGLWRYFLSKGLGRKEALGAAFATATIHKREGMPTRRSLAFSKNGRRTKAIENAFNPRNLKKVEEIFTSVQMELTIINFITEGVTAL